jgi:peptide/nickel transport system permease protein
MSLLIGAGAMTLSFVVGVTAGLIAGYHGGWLGAIAMRVADVQAAFPSLLLAIAVAAFLRPSIPILLLVLALRGWVVYARLTRGAVLSLMAREFVVSAVAVGAGRIRILLRHILPGMMSTLIVVSGLQFGQFILAESTLSFLGVGIQPPTASWGGMLSDGRSYLGTSWWLATFPGLAIVGVVLGANLIGDALPRWLGLRRSV